MTATGSRRLCALLYGANWDPEMWLTIIQRKGSLISEIL